MFFGQYFSAVKNEFLDRILIMDRVYQRDMLELQLARRYIQMKMLSPVIGKWYKDMQTNALFEIVAWDPQAHLIELQYLDGEITEYDLEGWRELTLESAVAPEDWRAAFELDGEDSLDPDQPYRPEDWRDPVSFIEPEFSHGVEEF
jgi:hypothetical protein